MNMAKRKERSGLKIEDWQMYGFGTSRLEEFDKLAETGDSPKDWIPRVHCRDLTIDEFWEKYEQKGLPCLIDGIPEVEGWLAWERWSYEKLCKRYADVPFKVGKDDSGTPIRVPLDKFNVYTKKNNDDSPLYVFDNKFGARKDVRDQFLKEYRVPSYFPDDYMAISGEDGRPPYRWVALGPRRSGTVMHIDPLSTNAWNTLLAGRKRWVLLKPETPRSVAKGKHVMGSKDDDEAVNVFLDLLPRMRERGVEYFEFVQYPGETVFLPGGWWHCVVNVDDTVAVTQNYAGRHNFKHVWRQARTERPCWSHRWLASMGKKLPDVAIQAMKLNDQDKFDMEVLLRKNKERRARRKTRRELRALRQAKRKAEQAGRAFDEDDWRKRYQEELDSTSDSSSTMSTSSRSTTTDESDGSEGNA